jgi:hypothetical protein
MIQPNEPPMAVLGDPKNNQAIRNHQKLNSQATKQLSKMNSDQLKSQQQMIMDQQ